jgi:bacterial/archaeal transporter family-2 protein
MLLYIALAALTGLLLPLQSLIAARLAEAINGPLMAALVNFVGGTLALALVIVLFRVPWPSGAQAASVPAYVWMSGLLGAFFVAQAAFTIPKLGAAGMVALVVAGQMIGSVLMDHFGILQPVQPVTLQKLLGAVFLLAGVVLILRPWH